MSVTPIAKRRYDAASKSSRTSSWITPSSDANAAINKPSVIRDRARDLVRNSPWAQRAVSCVVNNTIGYGIRAQFSARSKRVAQQAQDLWQQWAETTAIDAAGLHTIYGIQQLAMRCLVESGECLIRLRPRQPSDGLPVPMQVQVLEPDYLYTGLDGMGQYGNYISQGIEFDAIGRRVGYHVYRDHPGGANRFLTSNSTTSFVPASEMIHLFRADRPGQDRGVSWLAPVIIRLRELDIYEDAFLKRQQLANLFAAFIECDDPGLAAAEMEAELPDLTPGTVYALQPGRKIHFSEPPNADTYGQAYLQANLRAIAAGIGVSYESLTGDLSQVNFSSARMGAQEMFRNIDAWRWNLLIPRLCDRLAGWFFDAAELKGVSVEWTPPSRMLVDPAREVPAIKEAIRSGLTTLPEAIREQGFDPLKQIQDIAEFNAALDALGVMLDCDPRYTSGQGQAQATGTVNDTTTNP